MSINWLTNATTKLQALLYGIASGITGYLAYFLALPPSLQGGIMGQVISVCPVGWQPFMAGSMKTISVFLGIYATYKAAHSGPQTPPKNPPN